MGGFSLFPIRPQHSLDIWHISNTVPRGYDASQTSVHFMNYHFVWCPKYRKKLLVGAVEKRLKQLLVEKTEEIHCKIISLEIMPDHIHIFLQCAPTIAPNRIVAALKGYSSRILRKEFSHLSTGIPTLWTRSYFVSTYGHVSSEAIKKYVEEQKRC